jgi:hypothetical protein
MPAKNLKIDQLELDPVNPRISEASTQIETLQRIIHDQDVELVTSLRASWKMASIPWIVFS